MCVLNLNILSGLDVSLRDIFFFTFGSYRFYLLKRILISLINGKYELVAISQRGDLTFISFASIELMHALGTPRELRCEVLLLFFDEHEILTFLLCKEFLTTARDGGHASHSTCHLRRIRGTRLRLLFFIRAIHIVASLSL